MKNKSFLMTIAILIIVMSAVAQTTGTLIDYRDSKSYKTVKIGNQWWMAENLAYDTKFGYWKAIPEINYGKPDAGGIYTMGFSIEKFGYLYNYEASKTACPSGWRIPSLKEWQVLINRYEIGNSFQEKTINAFKSLIIGGTSGFEAMPGTFIDTELDSKGQFCSNWPGYRTSRIWASTIESNSDKSYITVIAFKERTGTPGKEKPSFYPSSEMYPPNNNYAITVRCICDNNSDYEALIAYTKAKDGTIADCNNYLTEYPNGKYITEVKNKISNIEMTAYENAKNGMVSDCNRYISSYPTGKYITEVKALKIEKQKKIDKDKADEAAYQEARRIEEQKVNDENNQKILNNRATNCDIGDFVYYCQSSHDNQGWMFMRRDFTAMIKGVIEEFNSNKTRAKVKVVSCKECDSFGTFDSQSVYNGAEIWVNIYGWTKSPCNQ